MRSPPRAASSPSGSCSSPATAARRSPPPARAIDEDIRIVVQAEQKGTGHAVLQAAPALAGFEGDVVVLYGDTPLIRPETLAAMLAARAEGAAVVVLGFEAADPGGYGRLIIDADGLAAIVEARDATPEQRAIRLCNSGLLAADAAAAPRAPRGGPRRTTPRANTT